MQKTLWQWKIIITILLRDLSEPSLSTARVWKWDIFRCHACRNIFAATCFFCVVKAFYHPEETNIARFLDGWNRLEDLFLFGQGPIKGHLGGGFKYFLFPPRTLEKIPILTHISQLGWLKPPTSYPPYWNPEIHGAWGLRFPNLPPLFRGNPKNFQVRTVQGGGYSNWATEKKSGRILSMK